MNATEERPAPVYALQERRRDRLPRVVYETRDPHDALFAAEALRRLGEPVEIVLIARDEGA